MAKKIDILQGQTGQIPFKAFYEGVSRPDLTTINLERSELKGLIRTSSIEVDTEGIIGNLGFKAIKGGNGLTSIMFIYDGHNDGKVGDTASLAEIQFNIGPSSLELVSMTPNNFTWESDKEYTVKVVINNGEQVLPVNDVDLIFQETEIVKIVAKTEDSITFKLMGTPTWDVATKKIAIKGNFFDDGVTLNLILKSPNELLGVAKPSSVEILEGEAKVVSFALFYNGEEVSDKVNYNVTDAAALEITKISETPSALTLELSGYEVGEGTGKFKFTRKDGSGDIPTDTTVLSIPFKVMENVNIPIPKLTQTNLTSYMYVTQDVGISFSNKAIGDLNNVVITESKVTGDIDWLKCVVDKATNKATVEVIKASKTEAVEKQIEIKLTVEYEGKVYHLHPLPLKVNIDQWNGKDMYIDINPTSLELMANKDPVMVRVFAYNKNIDLGPEGELKWLTAKAFNSNTIGVGSPTSGILNGRRYYDYPIKGKMEVNSWVDFTAAKPGSDETDTENYTTTRLPVDIIAEINLAEPSYNTTDIFTDTVTTFSATMRDTNLYGIKGLEMTDIKITSYPEGNVKIYGEPSSDGSSYSLPLIAGHSLGTYDIEYTMRMRNGFWKFTKTGCKVVRQNLEVILTPTSIPANNVTPMVAEAYITDAEGKKHKLTGMFTFGNSWPHSITVVSEEPTDQVKLSVSTTNNMESPSVQYTYTEYPDGTVYKGSVVFRIK